MSEKKTKRWSRRTFYLKLYKRQREQIDKEWREHGKPFSGMLAIQPLVSGGELKADILEPEFSNEISKLPKS